VRRVLSASAAGALALLLCSCPSPLTDVVTSNARDDVPPAVSIITPTEYSSFGRTIEIQGQASDAAASGAHGQVSSLVYEILARTAPKPIVLGSNGSFQITENTDLRENIVVEIRATDWNGNVTAVRLPLVWEGNDIPTFTAASANRQITLDWDLVPGASTYTIYYETSALAPTVDSPGRLENVSPPYVLNGLKNGTVYSFLVRGVGASGQDNYSSVQRATPLSSYDLFPAVDAHFNYIEVSWRPFATLSQYEVMRATEPGGPFRSVSGPVTGTSYRDTSVQQGVLYYYAVKPAQYSEVLSEVAEAVADPFPTYRDADIVVYNPVQSPQATALKGQYLLVADLYGGLHVADVSSPATPVPVTTLSGFSGAKDITVSGNYAYMAHGQSLSVFDITNPASPQLLDTLTVTNSQAEGVAVMGNLAYVACFNDGFSVVDATDKSNLVLRAHDDGTAQAFSQVYSVAAVNRGGGVTALFVTALAKTAIYEITGSAASPTITLRSNTMSYGRDIKVVGNTAYLSGTLGGWQMSTYNVTSLTAPTLLDSIQPAAAAGAEAIDVSGTRAYVTTRDTGFVIINVADPANLSIVQAYTVAGEARGVTTDGTYAYICGGTDYGIAIYGVSALRAPTVADTYTSLSGATNLAVSRDHVLVTETANDWQMTVVDATDPLNLGLVGSGSNYTPQNLKVVGNYAIFASERSGIERWDISDLSNPHVIYPWYVDLPGGYAVSIDVLGGYAYVGSSQSTLNVVDLSWPNNMALAGSIATQGNTTYAAADVAVKGDFAFVANSQAGLRIVDVSDPRWPSVLSGYGSTGGTAVAVAVSGRYALVADTTTGLWVFDVTDPGSWPAGARTAVAGPLGGGATDVVVRGNFAYVARGANGIQVWDITNPRSPVSVLSYDTVTFTAQKLAVNREQLYAIDGASTLTVLDLLP
jgi:hypothetical protein